MHSDPPVPRPPQTRAFGLAPGRPPFRPPTGFPASRERRVGPALAALVIHVLLIILLIAPTLGRELLQADEVTGAGGPGPAGGGGGGSGGTGGQRELPERLRYIQVAPEPPPLQPPVEEKKREEKQPEKPIPVVEIDTKALPATVDISLAAGVGGGSGTDGSAGSGPGSGGGVGSGIGTGRGSGTGPGTGGGEGTIYPPTPLELIVPPYPTPQRVKGTEISVVFDVDERGNVVAVDFTPTRDGGYNRRLKELLKQYRFRPATRMDGTPVRFRLPMQLDL